VFNLRPVLVGLDHHYIKRKGSASKFYVCEFVYPDKRFQESTGATSKTVAKECKKRWKAEMERAAGGLTD
jgi:hypothetical protein